MLTCSRQSTSHGDAQSCGEFDQFNVHHLANAHFDLSNHDAIRVPALQLQFRGLPTQLEACNKYAHEKGCDVIGEFSDDISGAKLDRPGLDKLREMLQSESIDAVIVYDIDRLSRKVAHQVILEEEFAKRGAQVQYVLGQDEHELFA